MCIEFSNMNETSNCGQPDLVIYNDEELSSTNSNYCSCLNQIEVYNCEICCYKTFFKTCLKEHFTTHHNSPQLIKTENFTDSSIKLVEYNERFECSYCKLTTFSFLFLSLHEERCNVKSKQFESSKIIKPKLETQPTEDEVNWFYCTPYKCNVTSHIECKHKIADKTKWFKCKICDYKGKRKFLLKTHIMRKHDSNMKPVSCDFCDHRTINQSALREHYNLKHANGDEIVWFKCSLCDHRSKTSALLKSHHKNLHMVEEDIKWFKCDTCDFKSKWKPPLDAHKKKYKRVIKEMDGSQCEQYECVRVQCFDCNLCDFKTTTDRNLKKHQDMHLLSDEVEWFECEFCDFKSLFLKNLQFHHNSRHATGAEVYWFECKDCSFTTKWKSALDRHKVKHVSDSEVTWFNCEFCDYKARERRYLQYHLKSKHADKK